MQGHLQLQTLRRKIWQTSRASRVCRHAPDVPIRPDPRDPPFTACTRAAFMDMQTSSKSPAACAGGQLAAKSPLSTSTSRSKRGTAGHRSGLPTVWQVLLIHMASPTDATKHCAAAPRLQACMGLKEKTVLGAAPVTEPLTVSQKPEGSTPNPKPCCKITQA